MAKYKVYNDNVFPYTEKFKDQEIKIQPKQFIVMDEDDAYMFKGSFKAPVLDADGNDKPEGYKMIRLVKVDGSEALDAPKFEEHICMGCKYKAANKEDLLEHEKAAHAHQVVVDESIEDEIKTKKKKTA